MNSENPCEMLKKHKLVTEASSYSNITLTKYNKKEY